MNFESIASSSRRAMLAFASKLTRVDPEDLVQDALLQAAQRWHSFSGDEDAARRWLLTIVYNRFVSRYRRLRTSEVGRTTMLHNNDAPSYQLIHHDVGDEVASAMRRLDPEVAVVVQRADLDGVSYRDLAVELGVSVIAVRTRLHRGRAQLALQLRDYARRAYRMSGEGTAPRDRRRRRAVVLRAV